MCLILFAHGAHSRYRLIVAANRDEFYDRPTQAMCRWRDDSRILAGRDLQCGGTWMGMTDSGRLAALTNYRDPSAISANAPSRGLLVSDFLKGNHSPSEYLSRVDDRKVRYNGFNLLVGDAEDLFWYSNRKRAIHRIQPGTFGLSNHLLDTPWPKVVRGKARLSRWIETHDAPDPEGIFAILADRERPADHRLPDTGVGMETERMLSPLFIESPGYGTRSSTVILWGQNGRVDVWERTFAVDGGRSKAVSDAHFILRHKGR